MQNVKEQVRDLLQVLPEDVTFDEVHYHILVREKIEQGLEDIKAGRVFSEEEMDARFKKWLEK